MITHFTPAKKTKQLLLLVFFLLFGVHPLLAQQIPLIKQWEKEGGGWSTMIRTTDGGLLRGGSAFSVSKIDANATSVWSKSFIGGGGIKSMAVTADGGYLLGGWSSSGAEGDKTEPSRGGTDYWVVKINADGTKVWDKTFGGSGEDMLESVAQTADGGYILGGTSTSGADGDKSQASRGGSDYWVVKIDANGTKIWDKRFGGSGEDLFVSMVTTADDGFLLGGNSTSGADGDKTQPEIWGRDFWAVKLNADGDKVWDKRFGGAVPLGTAQYNSGSFGGNYGGDDELNFVATTSDGGYVLGGRTHYVKDARDDRGGDLLGIVKLNANGSTVRTERIWVGTRFYGDRLTNYRFSSITSTSDGHYLVGGYVSAPPSYPTQPYIIKFSGDNFITRWDGILQQIEGMSGINTIGPMAHTTDGGYLLDGAGKVVKLKEIVPPVVSSFTPSFESKGTSILIKGINFLKASSVSFNNSSASTFKVLSDTLITATVPNGATTGKIKVTNSTGSGTSSSDFTLIPEVTCGTKALAFDGVDDYAVADVSSLYASSANALYSYTIEARVNVNEVRNSSIIVGTNSSGSNFSHQLRINNGRFEHYTYDGSGRTVQGTTAIVPGTWYHVAIVATGNNIMRLYVNGVEDGNAVFINTPWNGLREFRFGSGSSGFNFFSGVIEEVRLWNTALSGAVIQAQAKDEVKVTSSHGSYSQLKGYWKMEEGAGTTTANKIDAAAPATLVNMAASAWVDSDSPISCTPPAASATVWTGTASGDWHDPANWSNGVPDGDKDVIIKAGTTYSPLYLESRPSFTAKNLTIEPGATLNLSTQLDLYGDLVNNGTFTSYGNKSGDSYQSTSRVHVYAPVTIGGSNPVAFYELWLENGATTTLATDVSVLHMLSLKSDLNTGGRKLTLLSEKGYAPNVENLGGVVNGAVTVERYIDGSRNSGTGYRHYASPVASTTVADLATTGFTPVVNPAYNTAAIPTEVRPFPNIFGYDQSRLSSATATTGAFDYGWYSPASTSAVLTPGVGYAVNIPASAKVDLVGTLNNGTVTVSGLGRGAPAAAGWHLLGNPYPSSLQWSLLEKPAGLENAVYVYRSSGQYAGTYAAYVNGVGSSEANIIAPMQGFFVRVSNGPVSFAFTNSARTTSAATFFRTTADERPQLQLKLMGGGGLYDDTYVYFQQEATASVNGAFDAYKVLTYNADRPTLFARLGQDAVAIKGLPLHNASQSLPLEFYVTEAGSYTFSVASFVNFPAAAQVRLVDRETGQNHALSQGSEITLSLSPSTDPHRFMLSFSAVAGSPLSIDELTKAGVEAIIYPNPSQGEVKLILSGLQASAEKVELVLYNALGQQVLRRQVSVAEAQAGVRLETAAFAKGIYHLHIQAEGRMMTRKLVLNK